MPDKTFLEEYPLYRKFRCALPAHIADVPRPAINMDCAVCRSPQTFVHHWPEKPPIRGHPPMLATTNGLPPISPAQEIRNFHYRCSACKKR